MVIAHWGLPFVPNALFAKSLDSFLQYGRFGVIIFFVLSGYLITSILLNVREKNAGESKFIGIKNFFARRVLRIFPIYYLLLLLVYLANDTFIRSHIWYYLGYSSNLIRALDSKSLPHFWTLAVEEQFYLVWPWLILLINRKYIKYVFIFFIFLGAASQYLCNTIWHMPYGVLSINCFDSFGIGALYAYARLDSNRCRKFEQVFRFALPLFIFLAWKMEAISGQPIGVMYLRELDNLLALAMIIFALNNQSEWMRKYVLENRAFNFIGKISYGIYVYHFTFGTAFLNLTDYLALKLPGLRGPLNNEWLFYGTKFAALIFVCWLSYRFIEQPIMRLKSRFEYSAK